MLRAVDEEDRQARRKSILEAARLLFREGDGRLPTAAEVAAAVGLAKGTVYIYFKTKEEIFANLLLEGWLPVMHDAHTIFEQSKGRRSEKVQAFITNIVQHLGKHPELLRLDALSSGVLEKNMTPSALVSYKTRFNENLIESGSCLDRALHLEEGRGVIILIRTYALTRGLWQTTQHSDSAAIAGIAPVGKVSPARFPEELTEALTEYWRGALASK